MALGYDRTPINPNEYQQRFEDPNLPNPVYDPMGELRMMLERAYGGSDEEPGLPTQVPMNDPQEFIRMQLAGDVVPLPPGQVQGLQERMQQPGVYMGSRGAGAISQMGGRESPYLDLLNILSFPSGRSMAPPMRR